MEINVCNLKALHDCTGCGMCAAVCKCGAVSISENNNGFYRPQIDANLCIGCGVCTKVCYRFDDKLNIKSNEDYECYSAVNKNQAELASSSSGAVSIELMRECLDRG